MSDKKAYVRKRLTHRLYVKSRNKALRNTFEEVRHMENMLTNLFNQPMLILTQNKWAPSGMCWTKNPEGVWQRFGNEFRFKTAELAMLAKLYAPVALMVQYKDFT